MFGIDGLDPRVYLRRLRDPLHKNSMILILNSLIPSLWGAAFWFVVFRFYVPREVGAATAVLPVAGLIALIATLGFPISLLRFLPVEWVRAREIINSTLTISIILALGGALTFALFIAPWFKDLAVFTADPLFTATFVIYSCAAAGSALIDSALIAQGRADYVFVKTNVFGASRIPLPALFAALGLLGGLAITISFTFGVAVAFTLGLVFFLRRVYLGFRFRPRVETGSLKGMMKFSLANYVATLIGQVPAGVIPLVVVGFLGLEQSAYFYAAWIGAGIVWSVSGSASTSLLAEGSRREATLSTNTRRTWAFVLVLQVPAVVLSVALANVLLEFFGHGYSAAAPMLRLLALGSFFLAFNNIYLTRLRVEKRNGALVAVVALLSLLQLGFAVALIPPWGLTGIGVAALLAQGLTVGVILLSRVLSHALTTEERGEERGKEAKPE